MAEKKLKVKVYRYNPLRDKEASYKTYEVSRIPYLTVLRVLEDIHENLDGTLAFPFHAICGHGACGVCTLMVNGAAVRACQHLIPEDIEELTIEPLRKSNVVKDLVVKI